MINKNNIKSEDVERGIMPYLTTPEMQNYLNSALGNKKNAFITNLVSVVNNQPELLECTKKSIVSGAIIATSLNLSLNKSFGYAYLTPFKNNKRNIVEAQFQIGYRGYIQLAMRTGQYLKITATPIYDSQFKSWNPIREELDLYEIEPTEHDKVIGFSAFFKLQNGFEKLMFWRYEKMLAHADKYSKAFNAKIYQQLLNGEIPEKDLWKFSSHWYQNFYDMGCKTMIRQILPRYGILSEHMEKAYIYDQAVIDENNYTYVDSKESRSSIQDTKIQDDVFNHVTGEIEPAEVQESSEADSDTISLDDL